MTEQSREQDGPFMRSIESEESLYAYLARLNEDGHQPELPTLDARGIGFLATLTDPDADHVHHVVTDESGKAHHCEEWCDDYSPCTWRPAYPVVVLSAQNPLDVLAAIAKEQREQDERDDARFAKVRADRHERGCAAGVTHGAARCQCGTPPASGVSDA